MGGGGGPDTPTAGIKNRADNVIAQIDVWDKFLLDPAGADYKAFRPNHGAFDYAQDLLTIPFTYGALHYAMTGNPDLAKLAGRAIDTLAAAEGGMIAHRHLVAAARDEHGKTGRIWQPGDR